MSKLRLENKKRNHHLYTTSAPLHDHYSQTERGTHEETRMIPFYFIHFPMPDLLLLYRVSSVR